MFKIIKLAPQKSWLDRRIHTRFEHMLSLGVLEEVARLLSLNYDANKTIMKADGVAEISLYLKGEWDKEKMVEKSTTKIRRYAKRQQTWLRHQIDASLTLEPDVQTFEQMAQQLKGLLAL